MAMLVFLALCVFLLLWLVSLYNRLVALRNRYGNAFAQIDVQLKRRYDLIPNLVETARGYLQHERATLEAVVAARNSAVTADRAAATRPGEAAAMRDLSAAEGVLGSALGRLFALSEAYPELKADQTMGRLAEELSSTENRIAFARQGYNDTVMQYNTAIEQFPGNVLASVFRFEAAALLEATRSTAEREVVQVRF
jgi:LemA protein